MGRLILVIFWLLVAFIASAKGATYTIHTNVLPTTDSDCQRPLVRTSDGTLHVFYFRLDGSSIKQIYHSYSSDGGQNWTEEAVTSGGSYDQQDVSAAIDSNNNLHVVWNGNTATGWYIRYRKYTTSWQSIIDISPVNSLYTVIAVDSNNYLHVAFSTSVSGKDEIRYIKSTDHGDNWGSVVNITSSSSYAQDFVAIAIAPNNSIHLVWQGRMGAYPDYRIRYSKSTDGGANWDSPLNLTDGTAYQEAPVVAVDSNNIVHVAWSGFPTGSSNSQDIRYMNNSGSWPGTITNLDGRDVQDYIYPSMAIDKNNYIYVSCYIGAYSYVWKYTSSWAKTTFSPGWMDPILIWAVYPDIGIKPDRTENGYAFVGLSGSTLQIHLSDDLEWDNSHINTRDKRGSVINMLMPFGRVLPTPGQ